ncbi:PilZ domain-containing protein [Solidesulfovibrio alcoholivorans]|uniref:PilZ domain-containing protein n=1 Tax=Solidesulfovibrio alcoholivorans TaxID=81406 RepID=UPI000496ECC1|nr:PilZ domain-containing protein [Solidesulfovibrio alcoholivorans]
MYGSIRSLFSFFLCARSPQPDPQAFGLLRMAAQQQALFQMTLCGDTVSPGARYLVCHGVRGNGLVLAGRGADPLFCDAWEKKEFPFRFLIQAEVDKFPKLHLFQGKVTAIRQDRKALTVAIPSRITILEQRRNVRLKLRSRHLPRLAVWGLPTGESQAQILKERCIVAPTPCADATQSLLKNISAGGLRLSLPWHAYAQHAQCLEQGRRLLVQLNFPGTEPDQEHDYVCIARVSNARIEDDPASRPEFGLQFIAVRMDAPHAHWQDIRAEGSLELLKLLQSYQLEYYRELKKALLLREEPDSPTAGRRGATAGEIAAAAAGSCRTAAADARRA